MSQTMSQTVSQLTPSQTIGPFFGNGLAWMTPEPNGALQLTGQVLDGSGAPVVDALLEAWQAGACSPSAAIAQLQRAATDQDGRFNLLLAAPQGNLPLAYVTLFARGLLRHLHTAVWLPGQLEHRSHPLLAAVLPAARRSSLAAKQTAASRFEWNIYLQGHAAAQETVFFEFATP